LKIEAGNGVATQAAPGPRTGLRLKFGNRPAGLRQYAAVMLNASVQGRTQPCKKSYLAGYAADRRGCEPGSCIASVDWIE